MPHDETQEPHGEVDAPRGIADGHDDDASRDDGGRDDGGHDDDAGRRPLPPTELLRLQPPFEARADGRYHVSELLGFHDRPFVAAAFTAALAREPAPAEVEALLAELRLGRRTKLDIVESLIDSDEGRAAGATGRITGVGRGGFVGRLRALPFVGRLWRVASLVARLPELARDQQQFETYATAQIERVAEHSNHVAAQLNRVIDYANHVVDYANRLTAHIDRQERRVADFVNARIDEMVAHVNSAHRDTVAHAEHQRQLSADYVNEQRQRVHDYINEELRPVVADATEAVSLLSDGLAALRADIERQQRQLNGQEEFLVQEKHEIVEAQKTALAEMEARLRSLLDARRAAAERAGLEAGRAEIEARSVEMEARGADVEAWRAEIEAWRAEAEAQRRALAELAARVEALRAWVESARAAVGEEV